MKALCVVWGKGEYNKGEEKEIHYRLLGDGGNGLGV